MRRNGGTYAAMIVLMAFLLLSAQAVNAADAVKGTVSDEAGRPLQGASVATVKGHSVVTSVKTGGDGGFEIRVDPGVTKILVFYDDESTPGWDYLPSLIDLNETGSEPKVSLSPGASVELMGDIQFVYSENLPLRVKYEVRGEDGNLLAPTGFPLEFGFKVQGLLHIPELDPSVVIVPVDTPTEIYVNCSTVVGPKVVTSVFEIKPVKRLNAGESLEIEVRRYSLPPNLDVVEGILDSVKSRLMEMSGLGFYLSKQVAETSNAEVKLLEARVLYESGDYPKCFDAAKVSYIALRHTLDSLDGLYQDASLSAYILVVFLAATSIAVGFLLSDSSTMQALSGLAAYIVSLLILYVAYPGSSIVPRESFVVLAALSFIGILALAAFFPRLMGVALREGRVSIRSILTPIFSIAKRSLMRRRFRFLLTLLSLTVLVMSFVTLTSFSEGYGLLSRRVSSRVSSVNGVLIRSSSWSEEEPSTLVGGESDTAWLLRQPEARLISLKAESIPLTRSVVSLNGSPLRGVIGFDPTFEVGVVDLEEGVVEGSLPGPGGVAISVGLKEKMGVEVGNTLRLRGEGVVLQGILDDVFLSSLRDIDGSIYMPSKLVNVAPEGEPAQYELQPCEPNEVVLAYIDVATRAPGVGISRIDVDVGIGFTPFGFAERLALERGYQVWSSSQRGVEYVALSSYLEGKGLPLVVPWAIVVLNVVVTMLNSLFERRREISIFSSVGLNPAQISAIFVAEASLTGFIAGGLGYLLGLGAYRLMGVAGLSLEVHQKVSAVWSLASIGIAISAVLVGAALALKSSVVITPSLTRRWRLEEREAKINQMWTTIIPVKLMREQVDDFAEFIMRALGGLESDPVRMISLLKMERGDGGVRISFVHKSTQTISGSFYTKNMLTIRPGPNGEYVVELESAGDMEMTHATGSMLRMFTMEWSTGTKRR